MAFLVLHHRFYMAQESQQIINCIAVVDVFVQFSDIFLRVCGQDRADQIFFLFEIDIKSFF